jgi:hypothetical protein
MHLTNSRNGVKPRNQPFQGEKVKKNGPKEHLYKNVTLKIAQKIRTLLRT